MAIRPAVVEAGAELLVEAEGRFVPVQNLPHHACATFLVGRFNGFV